MAVLTIDHRSATLHRDMRLRAVLPFDRHGTAPYPLLVLLHGLQGDSDTWLYSSRIERWAWERNLSVAMPQGDNSFWMEAEPAEGPVGDHGAYVLEVVELMREVFPVAVDRDHTFVGGFSMGGYGALRAALLWPDVFSKALIFSAACHFFEEDDPDQVCGERLLFEPRDEKAATDRNPRWLAQQLGERSRACGHDLFPEFKFIVGSEDYLLRSNRRMAACLAEQGADVRLDERPGGHTWCFIDDTLQEGLDWLVAGPPAET